ncbi:unnamed protein product [Fraxinus pennsylvanica]|uniref:VQ domain-containing protein n=1 Tax=Fraxinus pennsylvanica TaxID=56036 RepID=A0AAD1Z754_9LAMI|nr:unnamed protein product [Fraxinus pennsylvanica]
MLRTARTILTNFLTSSNINTTTKPAKARKHQSIYHHYPTKPLPPPPPHLLQFQSPEPPVTDMDRSPSRELQLQGPRPAPLKVRKDSHKIRKAPVAQPPQQLPPRPPVIIYTVSPKIIHANPNEFMSLVQRLTGTNSTSSTSYSSSVFQENFNNGAISPAARFASIEKTKPPEGRKLPKAFNGMEMVEGINISTEIDSTCRQFQGISSFTSESSW